MSLTGLKYDDCSYTHVLKETISPGEYMLTTPKVCDPCFVVSPGIMVDRFGASLCEKELIDVNSELLNITRKASDCPSKKFLPQPEALCTTTNYKECEFLTPEDTRLSNPICTGKEITVNRWEWLCRNPQDKAIMPFDWFIANRTIIKDAHRACLNQPLDQTKALPTQQKNKCMSYLDEQFQEGQWKNQLNTSQSTNSLFLSPCNKLNRL
jgi:hypothetical protein